MVSPPGGKAPFQSSSLLLRAVEGPVTSSRHGFSARRSRCRVAIWPSPWEKRQKLATRRSPHGGSAAAHWRKTRSPRGGPCYRHFSSFSARRSRRKTTPGRFSARSTSKRKDSWTLSPEAAVWRQIGPASSGNQRVLVPELARISESHRYRFPAKKDLARRFRAQHQMSVRGKPDQASARVASTVSAEGGWPDLDTQSV